MRRRMLILGLAGACAVAASVAFASETVTYGYDAKGRLVRVERSGSVNNGVFANYTFDKADNRTNLNISGAP